jgi:hypothetical protein
LAAGFLAAVFFLAGFFLAVAMRCPSHQLPSRGVRPLAAASALPRKLYITRVVPVPAINWRAHAIFLSLASLP